MDPDQNFARNHFFSTRGSGSTCFQAFFAFFVISDNFLNFLNFLKIPPNKKIQGTLEKYMDSLGGAVTVSGGSPGEV